MKLFAWGILYMAVLFYTADKSRAAEIPVVFSNVSITFESDKLLLSMDYSRSGDSDIEEVALSLQTVEKELPLVSPALAQLTGQLGKERNGRIDLRIPAFFLPSGEYTLMARIITRDRRYGRCLKSCNGRSLIHLADFKGNDYELRCKIVGDGAPFVRAQDDLSRNSWNFYYADCSQNRKNPTISVMSFKYPQWKQLGNPVPLPQQTAQNWRNFRMQASGNVLEVEIDGAKSAGSDPDNLFSSGFPGIRSADQNTVYIDDVVVTDLTTGKTIFADNFERAEIGPAWKICGGAWAIVDWVPHTNVTSLGKVTIGASAPSSMPVITLQRRGDGIDILDGGQPVIPLIFSIATTGGKPYEKAVYETLRNAYAAGIRLFAPIISITDYDASGHMRWERLDDVMAQALVACPEAKFLLRLAIPPAPSLPREERMNMARAQSGKVKGGGFSDTKVEAGFDASLASLQYQLYFQQEMERMISHFKSTSYGQRIFGVLVTGGGYELNWGQPITHHFFIDISKAQIRRIGEGLKAKYGNLAGLQNAWSDSTVTFDNPPLPGLEERTVSDLAGFRNPASASSRRVLDFLEIYRGESQENLQSAFDAVVKYAPNSFFGAFDICTVNNEYGSAGAGFGEAGKHILLTHPGASFVAGILEYSDRRAGGVSASTTQTWESVRMHGKILLNENDIRTPSPVTDEGITELSYKDTAQTMRREFIHTVIMERNAMWYFDMGYTGPWFDHPSMWKEMAQELKLGNIMQPVVRKSAAQTLVVLDTDSWKYYAQATKRIADGAEVPYHNLDYPKNYGTLAVETMMRMGAPKDFILTEDFQEKNGYKLYIFANQFYADRAFREKAVKLAEEGAVCVFIGATGLIDENGASLDNMRSLLGMEVKIDGPVPLTAQIQTSGHPLAAGFRGGERIGTGDYARPFGTDNIPTWYRFYVDKNQSGVEAVAEYAVDKTALAVRRIGKGTIIYSGVPITNPQLYRNIARYAGVHIYLDTNDALYADGNFIMVHTRTAGKKTIHLLGTAKEVWDICNYRKVGDNTDEIVQELPAKHTAAYYIGSDPQITAKLQ